MNLVLLTMLIFALFSVFCFRHFFIQLVALKFFLDAATLFLVGSRNVEASSMGPQSAAVLISAISALVFFIVMASGIQRFAKSKSSDLEVRSD